MYIMNNFNDLPYTNQVSGIWEDVSMDEHYFFYRSQRPYGDVLVCDANNVARVGEGSTYHFHQFVSVDAVPKVDFLDQTDRCGQWGSVKMEVLQSFMDT